MKLILIKLVGNNITKVIQTYLLPDINKVKLNKNECLCHIEYQSNYFKLKRYALHYDIEPTVHLITRGFILSYEQIGDLPRDIKNIRLHSNNKKNKFYYY